MKIIEFLKSYLLAGAGAILFSVPLTPLLIYLSQLLQGQGLPFMHVSDPGGFVMMSLALGLGTALLATGLILLPWALACFPFQQGTTGNVQGMDQSWWLLLCVLSLGWIGVVFADVINLNPETISLTFAGIGCISAGTFSFYRIFRASVLSECRPSNVENSKTPELKEVCNSRVEEWQIDPTGEWREVYFRKEVV